MRRVRDDVHDHDDVDREHDDYEHDGHDDDLCQHDYHDDSGGEHDHDGDDRDGDDREHGAHLCHFDSSVSAVCRRLQSPRRGRRRPTERYKLSQTFPFFSYVYADAGTMTFLASSLLCLVQGVPTPAH